MSINTASATVTTTEVDPATGEVVVTEHAPTSPAPVRVERRPLPPRDANAETLRTRLRQALAANATYLALGTPTNAQNLAQIRALTRECSALIRSALAELDDITGT